MIGGSINTMMIDEFQDTSYIQFYLFLPIIKTCENLLVVGDEKQSIYGFRGGDKRLFTNLDTLLKNNIDNVEIDKEMKTNEVTLVGYICKKPIYRQTPFGREIADILLAVNRVYGKSDYLPCIAWGRNAKFAENNLEVGDKAKIVGRFQSREYVKKNGEKEEKKVAYEISLSSIEKIQEEVEVEVKEDA